MQDFEKNLQALKEMLEQYPQGTHWCMAEQQLGFALDAEFLSELIRKSEAMSEWIRENGAYRSTENPLSSF